jgi:hypothetical protein
MVEKLSEKENVGNVDMLIEARRAARVQLRMIAAFDVVEEIRQERTKNSEKLLRKTYDVKTS